MNRRELNNEVREVMAKIPIEAKIEMVAKSRLTCESNWMMALVFSAGWDAANQMNIQVAKAVGKAEMHRLMRALGIERPKNDMEFLILMTSAMETFLTKDYFDYEFRILDSGKILGVVRQCYAYAKIRSIGAEKNYQCGCFGMRAGWYQAMGLEIKEILVKCLKDGSDQCEILVENIIHPRSAKPDGSF